MGKLWAFCSGLPYVAELENPQNMGNKRSEPKASDPYKVLGVDRGATPEQVRRRYTEMLLMYHPSRNKASSDARVIEIREAYECIVAGRSGMPEPEPQIDLERYTERYFESLEDDFYRTVESLFSELCKGEPRTSYPSFGTRETRNFDIFYGYFKKFRTQRSFSRDKAENKLLQREFSQKIRGIVDIIGRQDERLKTVIVEKSIPESYFAKERRRARRPRRETEFECRLCAKGFRNRNQMLVHLKSRAHASRVAEQGGDVEAYVEEEVKRIEETGGSGEPKARAAQESAEDGEDQEVRRIRENEKVLEELYARIGNVRLEAGADDGMHGAEAADSTEAVKEPGEAPKETRAPKGTKAGKTRKMRKTKARKHESVAVYVESVHFLTCAVCKERFESRNKLFRHLRDAHDPNPE